MALPDAEALYAALAAAVMHSYGPELGRPHGVIPVGIRRGGAWIAERLVHDIAAREAGRPPSFDPACLDVTAATTPLPSIRRVHADGLAYGFINVTLHRDDFASKRLHGEPGPTQLPFDVDGARILLIDDVLHTGRTILAALDQLHDFGQPASVELAVLFDRDGHPLPVPARFVGAHAAAREEQERDGSTQLSVPQSVVLDRLADGRFAFGKAHAGLF